MSFNVNCPCVINRICDLDIHLLLKFRNYLVQLFARGSSSSLVDFKRIECDFRGRGASCSVSEKFYAVRN